MKKMMMILAMMVATATSAGAMSYKEAKRQALFLADKMAYELNLTDEQYEAAYEINLDYLMAVNDRDLVFGSHWSNRNSLFRTVLAPWQYNAYISAEYFYRPVYWSNNAWQWRIYSHYGRTRFYRSRPSAYISYRGGRPGCYYRHRNWRHPRRTDNHIHDDMYMVRPDVGHHKRDKEYRDMRKYDRHDNRRFDRRDNDHRYREYPDMRKHDRGRDRRDNHFDYYR